MIFVVYRVLQFHPSRYHDHAANALSCCRLLPLGGDEPPGWERYGGGATEETLSTKAHLLTTFGASGVLYTAGYQLVASGDKTSKPKGVFFSRKGNTRTAQPSIFNRYTTAVWAGNGEALTTGQYGTQHSIITRLQAP